ncbi:MAG: hypothetical protein M0R38_12185 [Bacteroidia bacterium]|nr:hypothetical protein [Bacteroidia bacterium]
MEIERELERVIEKNKNRQYSTFETRVDLVAQDCLQEIRRLKDVIEFSQNQEGCHCCNGIESYGIKSVKTVTDKSGRSVDAYNTPYNFCPNCGRKVR